jgi:hypothetical protein
MDIITGLHDEQSSRIFLVLSVVVAREEVRLPERKKSPRF